MDISDMVIKTKRLTVRPLKESDYLTFREYVEKDESECRSMFEETLEKKDTLGIFLGEELAGAFLLYDVHDHDLHLGFSVKKTHRNEGVMTEALSSLSAYLFEAGFHGIYIDTKEENRACQRVLEKCGSSFLRTEEGMRKYRMERTYS
ncbi:MAG: GNAT family N-acetyltransferase [Erysipelotrichaceae bacterium]|nr:GNAT family N-acetyltransferase [Erysipelotrichaceae bacterium]